MKDAKNAFAALARQAERGDAAARAQLERDLIPIVRRVIGNGAATSRLDRRIQDETRRWEAGVADQDQLVRRVAHSLCASVIARMRPAVNADQTTAETIVSDRRRSA
jgi:hypothetical protein